MYYLKSEESFDSAHFLANYEGKCKNIHGHRWRVQVEIMEDSLHTRNHLDGMVVDFKTVKRDLKKVVEGLDHALIIEKGSLKPLTLTALRNEGFCIVELDFRPTAERFAKYFFDQMAGRGYCVKSVTVFETPNNCASYEENPNDKI